VANYSSPTRGTPGSPSYPVGCFGYLIQSFAEIIWPSLEASIGLLPLLGSLGELLTPLWLVVKGVDVEQWRKRAFAAT
jgi:hypothetical protein